MQNKVYFRTTMAIVLLISWLFFATSCGFFHSSQKSTPPKTVPIATGAGKLAIIIDDCGYSAAVLDSLSKINTPLTFSVLPYLLYSQTAIDKANTSGKQIMLHLPLQSPNNANAEKTTIRTTMSDAEIKQITLNAINAVPGAIGINNHQGDLATTDVRVMRDVLGVVAEHKLFFVDSMTTPLSIGCKIALECGVPTAENEIFIDNRNNVPYIESELRKAVKKAHNKTIICIGHARPNTARAISNMLPEIRRSGIELVFASQLVGS
ncbi:MAG: divergent polysaccharide deacetylase family protein [Bacillota bacterium]